MGDFIWEAYSSWLPESPHQTIDPRLQSCSCGFKWRFNRFSLLKMFIYSLIGRRYVYTCPQCLRRYEYRLLYHVVKDKEVKLND